MLDIQSLADKCGVARQYVDVTGKTVIIDEKARANTLKILGYPIDDEEALEKKLAFEAYEPFKNMLDPVTVICDGDRPFIYIRTKASLEESASVTWTLKLEDGQSITETVPLYEIEIADYTEVLGEEYDIRRLILDKDLPYGYHSFSFSLTASYGIYNSAVMSLIRAPKRAYIPKDIALGKKIWGVSVQLYAVRSRYNWGIGDFGDLQYLLRQVAKNGGQFVGLNPMHAGYPANPDPDSVSPYSPSSRNWLNVIYINVENIPEFNDCKEATSLFNSKPFQQKLKALRQREYVDYRGVLELKLKVIRTIFDAQRVDDKRTLRGREFLKFIQDGGISLLDMATYDALQFSLYEQGIDAYGWPAFPKEFRSSDSPFVEKWREEHASDVRFYCYLQFLAQEQLKQAYQVALEEHMVIGTYRDLAVGVAPGSCDVWSDCNDVYRLDGAVGAPPDPLGPLGQNWGLAPMSPTSLKKSAYRPFINLYRSNMRNCGALRIDHAAGLYRMWWVNQGESACSGCYESMPMHDLLGIIALESQRNKCLVIAEDLGTIPQELRDALKELGAYSYKLFFGERASDGGFIDPKLYEPVAMSALTTHDMPTIKGWWSSYDLDLGVKLGVYTQDEANKLRLDRENAKQRILDSLHGLKSVGDEIGKDAKEVPYSKELVKGLQVHMCKGASALYSTQLEDWIGVEKPVNVPGTYREYPNWKRKLTVDLEDIFSNEYVAELCAAMTKARI